MVNSNSNGLGLLSTGSALTACDIDRVVRRMKSDLALIALKRRLLSPAIGAVDALSLSSNILALQDAA